MTVTTASAARPSLARRAAEPVDHGSTTAMTPSMAATRSSPAARDAATAGSSRSMPAAMMAISPPVSARSSSRSVTRPDSVLGPAPKLEESTENAELPTVPAPMSSTAQIMMTARRRRTTSEASEDIMRSPPGLWPRRDRWTTRVVVVGAVPVDGAGDDVAPGRRVATEGVAERRVVDDERRGELVVGVRQLTDVAVEQPERASIDRSRAVTSLRRCPAAA